MRTVFGVAALLFALASSAQSPPPVDPLPSVLRDWRGWVLKDLDWRACPLIATGGAQDEEDYLCAWPGRIAIDAGATGATIAQTWRVEATSWVPLPGDADYWPQDVTVNGQPAPVIAHDEVPSLRLAPGTYQIKARIAWAQRPQQLRLPDVVGLVDLAVDGKAVAPLQRDGDELTLGRGEVDEPEADDIGIKVFRKVRDAIPAQLSTQLEISVSGQAREETFTPVLPAGFVPMQLDGDLPARIDAEGRLHLQVQPGTWRLTLDARLTEPLATLTAKLAPEPWPEQEIWSFEANPGLRVTSVAADTPIDPAQAGVPQPWRALPAFALADGATLAIEERSRGLAADDANRLTLQREAWLDFSGAGLTAKDQINGRMQRGWRLDVAPPYSLERAEADGEGLLVTQGGDARTGVELRNPMVNLSAGVRIAQTGGELPVAGWQHAFDQVQVALHLPYSWRLVAAPGADSASGSWIWRWTLLDVFLVAVIALAAARAFGWVGGAIVAVYLVLGYHERGAPLWTLLAAFALVLVVRALPAGRLAEVARWGARGACVLAVLVTLPFVATQVRYALYPQLENLQSQYNPGSNANYEAAPEAVAMNEPQGAPPPPPPPPAPAAPPAATYGYSPPQQEKLESIVVTGSRIARRSAPAKSTAPNSLADYKGKSRQRYAQNTVIQAGRGEPAWRFGTTAFLTFSGPVLAEQSVRLWLAPPWLVRSLRVVMLVLLGWTLFATARRTFNGVAARPVAPRGAAALAVFGLASLLAGGARAQGAYPSDELLGQMRERLTEAPVCAPDCANAARALVRAGGDTVRVVIDINAAERVAVPLPGDEAASLAAVRVDGAVHEQIAHHDGLAWLALTRGVHRVELEFRGGDADHLALKFPLKPAYVELTLDGWQATGVNENRLLGDTLSLARERRDAQSTSRGAAQQFPPYVEVERRLVFDLEWRVESQARRIAPRTGGFSVAVPLLPGEQLLSSSVRREDGKALLSFGADQDELAWSSRLDQAPSVSLTAPPLAERAEVWKVEQNPTWHATFSGVPEVQSAQSGTTWTHEFRPLPGETLAIALTRPEAVAGRSIAIDGVTTTVSAGRRALDTQLIFTLRSTQGGEHAIGLPPGAEVIQVQKNGQPLNVRPREDRLSLPVTPGAQTFGVTVRQAQPLGIVARTPAFALGVPAANLSTSLSLPEDRWVLFAFGPPVGPAVLYWGELVVMIVLAWALARTGRTPLKLWHWLLLGFGFSTGSWLALGIVVAWLFAFDWRERGKVESVALFDLAQIALVLITLLMLLAVLFAVWNGLLGDPDMSVVGNGSSARYLAWFADQGDGNLPQAGAVTLPLWLHRVAMLAWALWLAGAFVGWMRWAFGAWSQGGYWRSPPPKATVMIDPLPQAPKYEPGA
jgi:hypothetical protein